MRVLEFVTAFLAVAIVFVACTACSYLSVLDVVDFEIEPLIRGDLRPLFTSAQFWQAFPCLWRWSDVAALGPGLVVGVAWLGVFALGRRLRLRRDAWATVSLAVGVLPYAIGALALRDNTVAQDTGAWLVWMLVGPLYAALLALACLVASWWPRARAIEPAPAAGHA